MDIRNLSVFIEAAEQGSFTRAGEKLGYSQPTVSFQIKQLEKELGVQLFDRIGHTVTLTDAGRNMLPYAQQICHMSREMASGGTKQREPEGILRIGMADSLGQPLIGDHFGQFRRDYPKVSLHISTGDTQRLREYLDHNEVDLIFTVDDRIYDPNYVIADEEQIGVHFVASSRCPLAEKTEISLEELLAHPFLLTEKGVSYRRLMDERLARESREIRPALETGRADLICTLAEENNGIAFLPDYVTDAGVASGRLVRLNVADFQVRIWRQILYRRDKWVSLQMQAMVDHVRRIRVNSGK